MTVWAVMRADTKMSLNPTLIKIFSTEEKAEKFKNKVEHDFSLYSFIIRALEVE